MIQIILFILIASVVISVLANLIPIIICIVGCVLLFLFCAYAFSFVVDNLSTIAPIMIGLIVIGIIASFFIVLVRRVKYNSCHRWLNNVGIGKVSDIPGGDMAKSWAMQHRVAETFQPGYIISTQFYKLISHDIKQSAYISEDEFSKMCLKNAKFFQSAHVSMLINFLMKKNILLPFTALKENNEICFLPQSFAGKYMDTFQSEGAATEDEFIQICNHSIPTFFSDDENRRLVRNILEYFVSLGKADKVGIDGGALYVSTEHISESKLVRREINI